MGTKSNKSHDQANFISPESAVMRGWDLEKNP